MYVCMYVCMYVYMYHTHTVSMYMFYQLQYITMERV